MKSKEQKVMWSAFVVGALAFAAPLHAQQPAARDTSCVAAADSARNNPYHKPVCKNQTQSGMTDSTGKSTMGQGVQKTSPDANAPVTAKGDTLKPKDSRSK